MVAKRKKKFTSGEGARYITRQGALKKLQLSLKDFRRLCILKGIYPREPRNRNKAQKGRSGIKTLYHTKDILFLLQEPIIWKLRDMKVFFRKVEIAKTTKEFGQMHRLLKKHPKLQLNNIVKERYPTYIDALRDLDDCLTLCFLFSTFPSLEHVDREHFALCRRLTVEFMHAVIEAKALRKVFISIKGYYYQVEIKGVTITWIVPHQFGYQPQKGEVDFKIMSTFIEFYTIMLGFVNYRLYNSLNLFYPPKLNIRNVPQIERSLVNKEALAAERIAGLNIPLHRTVLQTEEEVALDEFPLDANSEEIAEAKKEAEKINKLKSLFGGLKFFLNREVPREALVFVIRCCGGEVSWDKMLFVGSTFDEDDESITHQIVDRPVIDKQFISRYYVQPQWVFDCINARELLPVNKYFIGEVLPPHLSPFVDKDRDSYQQYVPPEEILLQNPNAQLAKNTAQDEEMEEKSDDDKAKEQSDNEDEQEKEQEDSLDKSLQITKKKLSVKAGKVEKKDPWEKRKLEKQEYRLREKMVKNKHRRLYKSMMEGKKKRSKEVWLLKKKRRLIEEKQKVDRKAKTN
ncbi:hypothetical protein PPYR_11518 [Photinus pyralis]|uniref:Pescadillo homolog n=1 Tax=Photinus pyralis TaxID=7054 RepID=A0A1Y1K4C4_PHOPY|nr:pescadillo homolog [Photinus pyralis]KAB0794679.1 hypothetical protein PPYR_11518 [Photinus pyralis]